VIDKRILNDTGLSGFARNTDLSHLNNTGIPFEEHINIQENADGQGNDELRESQLNPELSKDTS
jgi:hypothetical protein